MMTQDRQAGTEPTDGRRARTRRALLAAGEQLFAGDFSTVSIDDLVAMADVAKGTFYNHFTDKADLYAALVADVREDMRAEIVRATAGVDDPARRAAMGFCLTIRFGLLHPERRRFLLASQRLVLARIGEDDVGIASMIADGIARGRFRIATAEAGVLLIFGLVRIVAALHADEHEGPAAAGRVCALTAILLRGLGIGHDEAEAIAEEECRIIPPLAATTGLPSAPKAPSAVRRSRSSSARS